MLTLESLQHRRADHNPYELTASWVPCGEYATEAECLTAFSRSATAYRYRVRYPDGTTRPVEWADDPADPDACLPALTGEPPCEP